jgi:hypothetical protein
MKPRLVFLHIPKTAGTTLIERYWHNDNFCAIDREPVTGDPDVIFGHTADFSESSRPSIYITALRDPIERLMSQYNFVKTQLTYMNGSVELDFYTWFINKDQMRPMPHTGLFDYLNRCNGYDNTRVWEYNRMYSNEVLHWDGEKTSIDWKFWKQFNDIKQRIDQENLQWFRENTAPKISHYIFTRGNVVKEFETICHQYNISFQDVRDIKRTNETALTMNFQGSQYLKFEDLSQEHQNLVRHELASEQEFYSDILSTHL